MAGEWEYAIYVVKGPALEYIHFSHAQPAGTLSEFVARFGETVRLHDSTDGCIRFVRGPQPTAGVLGVMGSFRRELVAVADGAHYFNRPVLEDGDNRPGSPA